MTQNSHDNVPFEVNFLSLFFLIKHQAMAFSYVRLPNSQNLMGQEIILALFCFSFLKSSIATLHLSHYSHLADFLLESARA